MKRLVKLVVRVLRVTWYQVPGGLPQLNIRNILSAGVGKAQLHFAHFVPVCNILTIGEAQLI